MIDPMRPLIVTIVTIVLGTSLALAACDGSDGDEPGGGSGGSTTGVGGSTGGSGGLGGRGAGGTGGHAGTGGVSHGDSITVQGSGFRDKSQPGPVLYDDFESGSVGASIENQPAVIGQWETGAGSANPEYTDAQVHEGQRACLNPFTEQVYNSSLAINLDFEKAYLDFWVRSEPLDPTEPDGLTRNWKPFRLYGNNDEMQSGVTMLNGAESMIVYFLDSGSGTDVTEWYGSPTHPRREWFHIQYWLELNDVGSADGAVRALVAGQLDGAADVEMRAANVPMNQVRVGHYWATDSVAGWPYTNPGADIYVDSVYFDTSWARVELGDAADYGSCTHREIQLVTAWSDTEVTFTVQQGSLPAGPAWVFVIDETDEVRASQAITLQ